MDVVEALSLFDYLSLGRAIGSPTRASKLDDALAADTVTGRDLRATIVHELDVQWRELPPIRFLEWADPR